MFRVLCIVGKEGKTGLFGKCDISQQEIVFKNEGIVINELTVVTKKGKIKHKAMKKIRKIAESEENVYTDIEGIKGLEKNKNNGRVINYLAGVSFKKWANVNGFSLSEEPFAIVMGESDDEEKERIFKIAFLMKLVTIYNCKDKALADEILEKTGLCVKISDGEATENAIIYTGESLSFCNRVQRERVYDIRIDVPDRMKEYNHLPMERILENSLKNNDAEKVLKRNKLKISGFYREKIS